MELKRQLIVDAFEKAWNVKDNGKFVNHINGGNRDHSNGLRSAKFVYEIAKKLKKEFKKDKCLRLHVQEVDNRGNKKPGEWLFDIAITKTIQIIDDKHEKSPEKINASLEWVVESEYHTGLKAFADDFGKLIVTNTINALYLNGLNQQKDIEDFINRRKITAAGALIKSKFKCEKFYLAFWPTPEKLKSTGKSQWDIDLDKETISELTNKIKLFIYDFINDNWEEVNV